MHSIVYGKYEQPSETRMALSREKNALVCESGKLFRSVALMEPLSRSIFF